MWGGRPRFAHSCKMSPSWLQKCGLNTSTKIVKICIFCYKSAARKGPVHLSNVYKIWCGGGSPRSTPACQNSPLWLLKSGLTATKITKMVIFGINFPQKLYPLKQFFNTKFGMGRESQVCTLMPYFTIMTFKMWAYIPKMPKMVIFLICP